MTPKVYIAGAGPGDPELLTAKAVRVLASADVVLHDDLVSAAILQLAPPSAKLISVGKRCGQRLLTQDDINRLLVHYGRQVATVVRLNGGDPVLFGRAGEEIEALRAASIDFEVIPGVTSALAAAAAAGISLTDRRIASHVLFTTAHRRPGGPSLDLRGLARADTTVVVYMPGPDYGAVADAALAAGLDVNTPCVIVSSISLPGQRILRTSLRDLPNAAPLPAPALVILGYVAGTHDPETLAAFWQAQPGEANWKARISANSNSSLRSMS